MTPWLDDGDVRLYHGDALEQLALMPSESVQCIVTSPPFWGLRDYGVDGQIGLEETPDEWCARLVAVMREARRVLRSDGVCWIEVGDTYAANRTYQVPDNKHRDVGNHMGMRAPAASSETKRPDGLIPAPAIPNGCKPKDLVGAPWLLAFALRADGWCLRSEVTWSRPNPMPESVTDRPTKSSSSVFLLTKAKWVGAEPGRYANLPEGDKRWLAAILDAEGSIAIKRAVRPNGDIAFGPQITVINTNDPLLAEVQRIVGPVGSMSTKDGVNRPVTAWSTSNTIARDVLLAVYPYLIAKRDQARIAIHVQSLLYHRGNAERRTPAELAMLERLHKALKAANQCEPQDLSWVPEPKYGKWVPNRYFFDADAIREENAESSIARQGLVKRQNPKAAALRADGRRNGLNPNTESPYGEGGRNARSVWSIPTEPTPFAHFATFPQALVERCIKSGSAEGDVILDPFVGSGTTCLVARRLGRHAVGIELNHEYLAIAATRLQQLSLFGAMPMHPRA